MESNTKVTEFRREVSKSLMGLLKERSVSSFRVEDSVPWYDACLFVSCPSFVAGVALDETGIVRFYGSSFSSLRRKRLSSLKFLDWKDL